ncbi:MAG: hypothetical protein IJZ72_03935 [Oscillospiraceae bacterium]|nr:hypothetical protein [Oscillospiraceae bacterium]
MSTKKALLMEVIGENAVIEGIEFDFEAGTFKNVFGGNTITVTEADRLSSVSEKYKGCAVIHCTEEGISEKAEENVLAAILVSTGAELPQVYGKSILVKQIAGSASGFDLFTDDEITELIDIIDEMIQKFAQDNN